MNSYNASIQDYLENLPDDRKKPIGDLRACILLHLPKGFEEQLTDGMIGYVVPHEIFPAGYHVNPKLPLPFISIANQKNYIAFYHMGLYAFPDILEWFKGEYPKHSAKKLDMGKSCVRFKNPHEIPFQLIGELLSKITVNEWIACYQSQIQK